MVKTAWPVLFVLLCLAFVPLYATDTADSNSVDSLLDLSLEDLMNIEIDSTVSLTRTKQRLVPAATMAITREDIQHSGARNLNELLDIYVPNLQWIRHHYEASHLGLRGIISDRDDKYLILVNGKIMNERTHYGAITERDMVLLRDIQRIDIVRGPGSVLYGPGAVSMVINITTENANTFEGFDTTFRAGAVEEFGSVETQCGIPFKDKDGGVYFYAGVSEYRGSHQKYSPYIMSQTLPQDQYFSWAPSDPGPYLPGEGTPAGELARDVNFNNDGSAPGNILPIKLHAQITRGHVDAWVRYTKGGQQFPWVYKALAHHPWGYRTWTSEPQQSWVTHEQLTTYLGYNRDLGTQTRLQASASFDETGFERNLRQGIANRHKEREYYGKIMLSHDLHEQHKIAYGSEISYEKFGLGHNVKSDEDSAIVSSLPSGTTWYTTLLSLFGEYQWTITPKWTTFLGARVDDQTYTNPMFSPRVALAWMPTAHDTGKLIWSRSVRSNFAEEMKLQDLNGNGKSDPETLDSLELRWERLQTEHLTLAGSAFVHYNFELIAYDSGTGSNQPVGNQKQWGLELEALYRTDRSQVIFSHGFTKLYDFDLIDGRSTLSTAEPYGYGYDLNNWSNHITKLTWKHHFDQEKQWTTDGSLRVYWGFPGVQDWNEYQYQSSVRPTVSANYSKNSRSNIYLNLGLQYQAHKHVTLRIDGHNLLGLLDKDLNKRNYYGRDYRSHATAVSFWAIVRTQ